MTAHADPDMDDENLSEPSPPPFWQANDCPSWCAVSHSDDVVVPSDQALLYKSRVHYQLVGTVDRTTEYGVDLPRERNPRGGPPRYNKAGAQRARLIEVYLAQGYRETGPRVIFALDNPTDHTAASGHQLWAGEPPKLLVDEAFACLTAAEAEQLAELVAEAVRLAREG